MGYKCDVCGHEWLPRADKQEPKVCPKCKSFDWNAPTNKQSPMLYEEFRDVIKAELIKQGKITWTEIRTQTKLPQKFPNNQWVHRMEKDIGLVRQKDKDGIIRWELLKNRSH